MQPKNLRDIAVQGQRVLLRVDYNVPLDEAGHITDDTRIRATIPTLKYLVAAGAAVIIVSHLGRPKGQVTPKYSLAPLVARLSELLGQSVAFAADCVGPLAVQAASALTSGQVLLLENLRFHSAEEQNDPEFSRQLAALATVMVNDAFGVSHRAHASVAGVAAYIPAVAGLLMEKELTFLSQTIAAPQRPFAAVIGGAKVSDKIGVIENLLTKVDVLVIGGGMANTFLAAQGHNMAASLVETDKLSLAASLLTKAREANVELLLPTDVVVADRFAADAACQNVKVDQVPSGWMALDIGPDSSAAFAKVLSTMKTIVWNGPMGVFEFAAFAKGTEAVAKAVAKASAVSIVGGGDSIAALEKIQLSAAVTHISTGGGASLELLEGKILPGVAALTQRD